MASKINEAFYKDVFAAMKRNPEGTIGLVWSLHFT